MAGLCEGGNEPPDSLKIICSAGGCTARWAARHVPVRGQRLEMSPTARSVVGPHSTVELPGASKRTPSQYATFPTAQFLAALSL
ncbi:hypothetical protein ANN_04650 [Periplaneta americana]|uniref:Uncharacterized protein n=1 Tax=Periplaneta americana TaxID=6978 RepID=A0ABQ8TA89_PERAM|nr:hypothetical protein ANN_04650 [Periplaneta americana]